MIAKVTTSFLAGLLVFIFQTVAAQEVTENSISKSQKETKQVTKHFLHAEIGGRAFVFGSLNYEYALHKRFSAGVGMGFINLQRGSITRMNDGVQETGKYIDLGTTQMAYGNFFIGRDKHKLIITAGLTNFLFSYKNKYPSAVIRSNEAQLEWNAGIGYQFSAKKMYFRLTGYCISMPDPSAWLPKYMPWGGITIGWKL